MWMSIFHMLYTTVKSEYYDDAATLVSLSFNVVSSAGVALLVALLSRSLQVNTEELGAPLRVRRRAPVVSRVRRICARYRLGPRRGPGRGRGTGGRHRVREPLPFDDVDGARGTPPARHLALQASRSGGAGRPLTPRCFMGSPTPHGLGTAERAMHPECVLRAGPLHSRRASVASRPQRPHRRLAASCALHGQHRPVRSRHPGFRFRSGTVA